MEIDYGNGDADEEHTPEVFQWTYDNYFFQWSNQNQVRTMPSLHSHAHASLIPCTVKAIV
jgi:hypothetical protein